MPLPLNPYTAGDPVGKTPAFVGRDDVLRAVMRVLRHPTQNAITLFGQRRIGKTSVLQHLEKSLTKEGRYFPVFFDLMGKAGQPLAEILIALAREIAATLEIQELDLGENPKENFREIFIPHALETLPEKASLVILLDEFDVLADPETEERTKKTFFEYLRDLRHFDSSRLQFIFVLGRNMDDLDIVAQSLFKDLPSNRVSLLSQEDTEKVIRLSEREDSLDWTEESVLRIWELTAGHPYLTQALCSQIWEDAYELDDSPAPVQARQVEKAISGALERSENMFVWLWNGLGPAEKVVASALAQAGPVIVDEDKLSNILSNAGVRILISELKDAPKILQEWDILVPANGGYRFSVELLRRWIEENKPLSRTQDELDHINPLASSYYQAARVHYRNKEFKQAIQALQQALSANPNHIRASELLGEILLIQGNLDEAQDILEKLATIAPENARLRLKQIYLQRASNEIDRGNQLGWYQKILKLSPHDKDVLKAQEFLLAEIQQGEIQDALARISALEKEQKYKDAYEAMIATAEKYPQKASDWKKQTARLKEKSFLAEKYRQGIGAIKEGDHVQAKKLFAEVIALDPDYEEVSRYFYWASTGEEPVSISVLETEMQKVKDIMEQAEFFIQEAKAASQESKARTDALAKKVKELEDNKEAGKNFSVWNPFNYFRLLWWTLIQPATLEEKQELYEDLEPVGNRLAYFLIFTPLVFIFLGMGLGLVPLSENAWQAQTYLWWTLAIFLFGGLMALFADYLEENIGEGMAVVVAFGVAFVVALVIAFGVAVGVAFGVVVSVTFGVTVGVTVGVAGDEMGLVAGGVAVGAAVGVAGSVAGGGAMETVVVLFIIGAIWALLERELWPLLTLGGIGIVSGLTIGWFTGHWYAEVLGQSILSIVVIIVTFVVAFFVTFGVAFFVDDGPEGFLKWIFALLWLSWAAFLFLNFGGAVYLKTGTFPAPVFPFGVKATPVGSFLFPLLWRGQDE